jgi:hypothetical protein
MKEGTEQLHWHWHRRQTEKKAEKFHREDLDEIQVMGEDQSSVHGAADLHVLDDRLVLRVAGPDVRLRTV